VRAEDYNRNFYRERSGLMPARLSAATAPDNSSATSLLGLDLNHSIFRFLKGQADPIPSATISRFFPASPAESGSRVLASYASGKPFLIEGSFGRGRVLLMSTSLDLDWGSLPISGFYLPFAQSAVRYLACGGFENRNLQPGEAIVAALDIAPDERSIEIKGADGKSDRDGISVLRAAGRTELRYSRTAVPGEYVLSFNSAKGPREIHYAVWAPPGESDLTPLSSDQWKQLRQLLGFEVIDTGGGARWARFQTPPTTSELWPVLLAMVIGLGLAEVAAARAWSLRPRSQNATGRIGFRNAA
jgi:hypothetical protein